MFPSHDRGEWVADEAFISTKLNTHKDVGIAGLAAQVKQNVKAGVVLTTENLEQMKNAIRAHVADGGSPVDSEGNELAPQAKKLSTVDADVVDAILEPGSGTISWASVWTEMHQAKASGEAGKADYEAYLEFFKQTGDGQEIDFFFLVI